MVSPIFTGFDGMPVKRAGGRRHDAVASVVHDEARHLRVDVHIDQIARLAVADHLYRAVPGGCVNGNLEIDLTRQTCSRRGAALPFTSTWTSVERGLERETGRGLLAHRR